MHQIVRVRLPEPSKGCDSVKHTVVGKVSTGTSDSQYLTRSEVASLLGVSPNSVTRWAREGRLACLVTLGGHHRFDREVVEQLRRQQYRERHDREENRGE